MARRFSLFGLIEYRRYSFGAEYLIIGKRWHTIRRYGRRKKHEGEFL